MYIPTICQLSIMCAFTMGAIQILKKQNEKYKIIDLNKKLIMIVDFIISFIIVCVVLCIETMTSYTVGLWGYSAVECALIILSYTFFVCIISMVAYDKIKEFNKIG